MHISFKILVGELFYRNREWANGFLKVIKIIIIIINNDQTFITVKELKVIQLIKVWQSNNEDILLSNKIKTFEAILITNV
jgi:hypothetical protein